MPRIFKVKASNPELDASHPDSKLPIRGEADVWLRLVRKYGFGKGMKLFGVWMAFAHEHGDVEQILDSRELFDINVALKGCGLVPDNIKPKELSGWIHNWFVAGYKAGLLTGEMVNSPVGVGRLTEGKSSE